MREVQLGDVLEVGHEGYTRIGATVAPGTWKVAGIHRDGFTMRSPYGVLYRFGPLYMTNHRRAIIGLLLRKDIKPNWEDQVMKRW